MSTIPRWVRFLAEIVGGWGSLMSGAISIPFAFLAIALGGKAGTWFAVLAFVTLWVFVIRTAWKNYQILAIQNPEKKRVLFAKMVDFLKSSNEQDDRAGRTHSFTTYDYAHIVERSGSIGALIKFVDEIHTEEDLKRLCDEFEKHGFGLPFADLDERSENLVKGRWLPVLMEARYAQREIKSASEFISFLATGWSDREKWTEATNKFALKMLGLKKPT
ncbi:MAG: hypothetical protein ABSD57_03015 [Verrucomicrobiota bacterium]|jgi:hypothetical protein